MQKVESFQIDHRYLRAPYIRKCCVLKGDKGDYVSKFDLRLVQPNKESIPTAALHALEHMLAVFLREQLDNIIDVSPMGCRTGFYIILWGDADVNDVRNACENALRKVLDAEEVPAANEIQCGNYRDLSLFGAKEYAKSVLQYGITTDYYNQEVNKNI